MPDRERDAALVTALRAGDEAAFGRLFDAWYDRVFDLSRRIVRDPDTAAEIVQDTFLAAWAKLDTLADPASFGGWLLRIARNRSFDRLEKEKRSTPVDGDTMATIESVASAEGRMPAGLTVEDRASALADPAKAAEDAEVATLVWEAAEALGDRDANVLDLHLRHGLSPAEIAEVIGVTPNNANQLVHRLRRRLGDAIRARVLWRGGTPVCPDLAAALGSDTPAATFGADTVKVLNRHAAGCGDCRERQKTRLAPSVLLSAVPFVAAPALFRARAAAAMEQAGVPMSGSASHAGDQGPCDGADPGGEGGGQVTAAAGRNWARLATVPAVVVVGFLGVLLVARPVERDRLRVARARVTSSASPAATGTPSPAAQATDAPGTTNGEPAATSSPATSQGTTSRSTGGAAATGGTAASSGGGSAGAAPAPAPAPPPPPPPVPPPSITSFGLKVVEMYGSCQYALVSVQWSTSNASGVTLNAKEVGADGSTTVCASSGDKFTLTAWNDAGSDYASEAVP